MPSLNHIESERHIDKHDVIEAVRQMFSYGAVKSCAVDSDILRATLNPSIPQTPPGTRERRTVGRTGVLPINVMN